MSFNIQQTRENTRMEMSRNCNGRVTEKWEIVTIPLQSTPARAPGPRVGWEKALSAQLALALSAPSASEISLSHALCAHVTRHMHTHHPRFFCCWPAKFPAPLPRSIPRFSPRFLPHFLPLEIPRLHLPEQLRGFLHVIIIA